MEYEAELSMQIKLKDAHNEKIDKVCTGLWERYSAGITNKIESRSDYINIFNDLIKLLEVIEENSLSYEESQYNMKVITIALRNCIN